MSSVHSNVRIVDEVHSDIRFDPKKIYLEVLNYMKNHPEGIGPRITVMCATPMETDPMEIPDILNILLINQENYSSS